MLNGVAGVASALRRVRRIVGAVAGGVADGAVDQHLAVPAHAELDRGVDAAAVEAFDRAPDRLHAVGLDADGARVDLGVVIDRGHRREILRNPAAGDHARQAHPKQRPSGARYASRAACRRYVRQPARRVRSSGTCVAADGGSPRSARRLRWAIWRAWRSRWHRASAVCACTECVAQGSASTRSRRGRLRRALRAGRCPTWLRERRQLRRRLRRPGDLPTATASAADPDADGTATPALADRDADADRRRDATATPTASRRLRRHTA